MSAVSKEFFLQSLYVLTGSIFHRALSLIAMILVARTLQVSDYGVLTYITTISLTIAPLVALGVSTFLIRDISKSLNMAHSREVCSAAILLLLISFSLFLPIYISLTALWPEVLNISDRYIAISYFLALSMVFHAVFVALFTATGKTKELALVQTFQGVISIPLYFYAADIFGILGALCAVFLTNLLSICILAVLSRGYIAYGSVVCRGALEKALRLVKKSYPIGVNDTAFSFLNLAFVSLIIRRTSDAELALFMAATQVQMIVVFIPTALSGVVLRYLSMDISKDQGAGAFFWWNMLVQVSYGLVLVIFAALFHETIGAIYGESFAGLSELLILSVACAVPMVALNLIYQFGVAGEKVRVVTASRIGAQLLSLLLLLSLFGDAPTAMSALVAKMGCYTLIALVLAIYILKTGVQQK